MKFASEYAALKNWCEDARINWACPTKDSPTKLINRLWEELHYYQVVELDELIQKLEGKEHISPTKESALKRLRPWLEKIFGSKHRIDDPEFVVRDRQRNQMRAERKGLASTLEQDEPSTISTTEEESTMNAATIKSTQKPNIKNLKKSNPIATKSIKKAGQGRPSGFDESAKITLLVKDNPKREGSASHKEFELYKKNKTVGAFLKAGGTSASLRWDSDKKFIKIS